MKNFSSFIWSKGGRAIFLAAILAAAFSLSQAQQTETGKNILAENYRIGVGDVIDVAVSKNDTLSKSGVRVNNTGGIQLPMLDADLPAACLTERELADVIREKYKKYLLEPYVNVTVKEFNSNPVAFIGAVNSPGRFQLQRPVRLLELVTYVNGPSPAAGESVEIIRNQRLPYCRENKLIIPPDADDELISLPLSKTLSGDTEANPFLKAGDIVRIESADKRQAYIVGNVKNALTIDLKEPVTLTQAIAMAGGVTAGAETGKIKIQRRAKGSLNPVEIIVSLKEINQRKKEDVRLEPDDIIEVPGPSGGKKILRDIFKALGNSAGRLPISVIP